jgi:hypothetical protein
MYQIGRKHQRRRIHTEAFLSHSYLPLVGDGGFEPFGALAGLLETTQQAETIVTRTPGEPVECLTLIRDGELEVLAGDTPPVTLGRHSLARSVIGGGDSVRYRTTGGQPVRYLEVMLCAADPVETRVEVARLPARRGSFLFPIASGQDHADTLPLLFDSAVYWGRLLPGGNVIFETPLTRRTFLVVLSGTVRIEEYRLISQDYARVQRESAIPLFAQRMSEVVLIDMP